MRFQSIVDRKPLPPLLQFPPPRALAPPAPQPPRSPWQALRPCATAARPLRPPARAPQEPQAQGSPRMLPMRVREVTSSLLGFPR
eukprot:5325873-Pyramimonas_sp.AAC.1